LLPPRAPLSAATADLTFFWLQRARLSTAATEAAAAAPAASRPSAAAGARSHSHQHLAQHTRRQSSLADSIYATTDAAAAAAADAAAAAAEVAADAADTAAAVTDTAAAAPAAGRPPAATDDRKQTHQPGLSQHPAQDTRQQNTTTTLTPTERASVT
jgi:hypothetical protein